MANSQLAILFSRRKGKNRKQLVKQKMEKNMMAIVVKYKMKVN